MSTVEKRIPASGVAVLCLLLLVGAVPARADSTLTLKLRDARSGMPTDARVRVHHRSWAFAELDHDLLTHSSAHTGPYVHAADSLVVTGPTGEWSVWISRGVTSVPVQRTVLVDGSATLTVMLDDWIDPRLDGWYGGDPHVHLFHDEGLHYDRVPPDRAAMAARAEGLDLMYLLENDFDHPGGPLLPAEPGVALVWGEEYRNSFWGHTVWLGLEELVWYPVRGAGCCGRLFPAWPTLAETFAEVDAGLRILAHPRSTVEPLAPFHEEWPGGGYARERAALALGDQLHGFAVASASNEGVWAFDDYLDALRSGARWAAVGEGDRALDRYTVSPPGHPRTYAWIGPGWSRGDPAMADAWEAAVLSRRSYATTGPIVRHFDVGGVPMGGELEAGPGSVTVSLSVAAYRPLTRIRLHGATGTHWESSPAATVVDTTITLDIDHDDFVLLDIEAAMMGWQDAVFPPRAVTSPVWIDAGVPWPANSGLARREADGLGAFFEQACVVRGFDAAEDSIEAWNDIMGAAAWYEALVDDPPAAFEMLAPPDGAQYAASSIDLEWAESRSYDGEPVSYHLVVARDPQFLDGVVDLVTSQASYTLEGVDSPTSFHWSVEALEPGDPPVPASNGPRHFFLTGGVVSAPLPRDLPFELHAIGADGTGVFLSLRLQHSTEVIVRWVDVRGRVVGEERLGRMPGGSSRLTLAARDREGQVLARGVYWLVAEAGPYREVVRVTWLR